MIGQTRPANTEQLIFLLCQAWVQSDTEDTVTIWTLLGSVHKSRDKEGEMLRTKTSLEIVKKVFLF